MQSLRHLFVRGTILGDLSLREIQRFSPSSFSIPPGLEASILTPETKKMTIAYLHNGMIPDYERIGQNSMVNLLIKTYVREKSPWLENEYHIIEEFELKEWLIYLIDELEARPSALESSVIHANNFSWDFMKTFIDRNECLSPEHLSFYMSHASINRFDKLRFSDRFHSIKRGDEGRMM